MKGVTKFQAANTNLLIITCNDHNPSQLSDGMRTEQGGNKNDEREYLCF